MEQDRQRAEVFDALGHPARITILKALSVEPVGFADLKKRLGIESSGHLQHHLSKLGNLVKIDQDGRYSLSEHGKDALFAVQTVEKVTEPRTRGGGERFSRGAARLFSARGTSVPCGFHVASDSLGERPEFSFVDVFFFCLSWRRNVFVSEDVF